MSRKHDADDKYSRYMAFVDAVNRSSVHHIHCVLHSSVLILQHGVLSLMLYFSYSAFAAVPRWEVWTRLSVELSSIHQTGFRELLAQRFNSTQDTLSFRVQLYYLSLYTYSYWESCNYSNRIIIICMYELYVNVYNLLYFYKKNWLYWLFIFYIYCIYMGHFLI